jgi:hypothetical protein
VVFFSARRYPRLVLADLTTEAMRRKSPDIELGSHFSRFCAALGIPPTTGPPAGEPTLVRGERQDDDVVLGVNEISNRIGGGVRSGFGRRRLRRGVPDSVVGQPQREVAPAGEDDRQVEMLAVVRSDVRLGSLFAFVGLDSDLERAFLRPPGAQRGGTAGSLFLANLGAVGRERARETAMIGDRD